MKKQRIPVLAVIMLILLGACKGENLGRENVRNIKGTDHMQEAKNEEENTALQEEQNKERAEKSAEDSKQEDKGMKLRIDVGESIFTATLENNEAAKALADILKDTVLTIEMSDYSGFEKVGNLARSLPSDNRRMSTQSGDIVLYNSSQIVLFYDSNTWTYTKLARVDDLEGWEQALGRGGVTVRLSLEE